jgi:hypothetical protein
MNNINLNIEMDNKITFLKAVLLGIHYGKSDNSEYYKKSVEKEIHTIYQKSSNSNSNTNTEINEVNKINQANNINTINIENKILNLENQKNYVISLIQKLSFNYALNIHKINVLKKNLFTISKEIDKNKELLKTINTKENSNKDIFVNELERTLGNLTDMLM